MSTLQSTFTSGHRHFLASLFPGDALVLDTASLTAFATDASRKSAMPWAVVRPESTQQVSELLRWAQAEGVPIYPRARGTNKVGAVVPVQGGIVVSTLRMDRIIDIDSGDFVAEVEPGVVTSHLAEAAAAKNMFYPPDPASVKSSTVGGNVATCAGGLKAVKYGVTRDYVLGLTAVLPGGAVVSFGSRCHKDVVGLDLARLFVGSAGTLGIVTRLVLKLLPLPEARASVLAAFSSPEEAVAAAQSVFRAGILPTACEFMDSSAMGALSRLFDAEWLHGAGGAILLQVDGISPAVDAEIASIKEVLQTSAPVYLMAGQGAEEEQAWEMRRQLSQAGYQLGPDKLPEDVAVPRGRLLEAVAGFRAISAEQRVPVIIFGHLGDGNLHVNTMHDASDVAMATRAATCRAAIVDLALSLGGTASGEHGLGLSKREHLTKQISPAELALMRQVKAVFDPQGIMNPGKEW
ncbi:MAG: FAD-binding protein [Proteobacteria bacterium]|nr:FAD-binding protein [Pseudomonadota bacterium]MBU1612347.1 FAD-binding protein [Pseudomonadota bacterium]